MEKYSFLMPVYIKENPLFLKSAIESMVNQTLKADEIVIVCDGPLTDELNAVIDSYKDIDYINVIRCKENKGLGTALRVGIDSCKNDVILRADSDDISELDRAMIQIPYFDQGFDIVGSAVAEFDTDPNITKTLRMPPETQEEINKFAKKRCPFNHPSVAYRKTAILKAGGYLDFYFMEDYYLWVRCLLSGAKVTNIQKPLVKMRCGVSLYKRRSGKQFSRSYKKLFKFMREKKMINYFEYLRNNFLFFFYSHINPKYKKKLAAIFLRKKNK